jgi:perosamine synthetase
MIKEFIHQMEPSIGKEEIEAMNEYLSSGAWLTEFHKTKEFEKMICEFTGSKHCAVVNNGTVSLVVALLAAGIGPGDEVLVPDFTMIASPNSVILAGAKPVLVDIEKETLCIDIEKARAALTENTKCLMHVSFNGRTNDLRKIKQFCEENNLIFLEDSAQSLGSFYKGKHIGTYGDIGSFSFSTPKIITTGQGGALITDNTDLYDKISRLKDFGRARGGIDIHDTIGYNFKFTDMQAVIGIEQMKRMPERMKRKKHMFKLYQEQLSKLREVEFIKTNLEETAPWFIDIFVKEPLKLAEFLKKNNVGTRAVYPPIHTQRAYNIEGDFPVTEKYANMGLWLPSSIKVTDEQIVQVCSAIKKFYGH